MSGPVGLEERVPGLDLSVGALVVYGGYGVGRVSARSSAGRGGAQPPTVAIEFPSDLSVTLPLERAEACLRPPAGAAELEGVRAALRSRNVPIEDSWKTRTRDTRAKIAAGDLVGLAEVVRDAVERQRRRVGSSTISSAEQDLYRKARGLLAAELVVASDIDALEAESWIEDQLDGNGE